MNRLTQPDQSHATLRRLDHAYLWHPFTPMQAWFEEDPVIIVRGDGNELIDDGGKRYLDGVSSLWCNVHGHNHPSLNAAITEQLGQVAHTTLLGLTNVPAVRLAERLVDLAPPGLTRVFYSDNGATAEEARPENGAPVLAPVREAGQDPLRVTRAGPTMAILSARSASATPRPFIGSSSRCWPMHSA